MSTIRKISGLAILLLGISTLCHAMMEIENVTKARAKALGMEIRSNAAGPDAVRVELEFAAKGELKSFTRVDLEIWEGGKLFLSTPLKEEKLKTGRIMVSFAASRAKLDQFSLRVVTEDSARSRTGHDLRMKEFVDLSKLR